MIYIIYHRIYHGIYHGIYYDIYYGIYYDTYHAPVVYIMHLKRSTAKAHRMLLAFSIFHLENYPVLHIGLQEFQELHCPPQTAGAAGHSLQLSSQSYFVACSTSMQSGGPQSACPMDPQRVATYTGGELVQQSEYRH
jgi:hypothetical protein